MKTRRPLPDSAGGVNVPALAQKHREEFLAQYRRSKPGRRLTPDERREMRQMLMDFPKKSGDLSTFAASLAIIERRLRPARNFQYKFNQTAREIAFESIKGRIGPNAMPLLEFALSGVEMPNTAIQKFVAEHRAKIDLQSACAEIVEAANKEIKYWEKIGDNFKDYAPKTSVFIKKTIRDIASLPIIVADRVRELI